MIFQSGMLCYVCLFDGAHSVILLVTGCLQTAIIWKKPQKYNHSKLVNQEYCWMTRHPFPKVHRKTLFEDT